MAMQRQQGRRSSSFQQQQQRHGSSWMARGTLLLYLMALPSSRAFIPMQQQRFVSSIRIIRNRPLDMASRNDSWNPINRSQKPSKPDLYSILQVTKYAGKTEIKSAYRKLAKIYHPDANVGNAQASTEKFQQINRAYEVLNDPTLKHKYDKYGERGLDSQFDEEKEAAAATASKNRKTSWSEWTRSSPSSAPFNNNPGTRYYDSPGYTSSTTRNGYGPPPPHASTYEGFAGGAGSGRKVNSDEFFGSVDFSRGSEDFFSVSNSPFHNHNPQNGARHERVHRSRASTSMPGSDLMFDMEIDMKTAMFGGEKELPIRHLQSCSSCKGSGLRPGGKCPSCQGKGTTVEVTDTPLGLTNAEVPCHTCRGSGNTKDVCSSCHGEGLFSNSRVVKVKIPAGIKDGKTLCLKGQGDAGMNGAPAGNLYIYLKVLSDRPFSSQRNGQNPDGQNDKKPDPFQANGRHAHTRYQDYAPPRNGNAPSNGKKQTTSNGFSSPFNNGHEESFETYFRNNHEAFRTKNGSQTNKNGNSQKNGSQPSSKPFTGHNTGDFHANIGNGAFANGNKEAFFRNGFSSNNNEGKSNDVSGKEKQKPFFRNGFTTNDDSNNSNQVHNGRTNGSKANNSAKQAPYVRNGFFTSEDNLHNGRNGHSTNGQSRSASSKTQASKRSFFRGSGSKIGAFFERNKNGKANTDQNNNGFDVDNTSSSNNNNGGWSNEVLFRETGKGKPKKNSFDPIANGRDGKNNFYAPPAPQTGASSQTTASATQIGTQREIVVGDDLMYTLEVDFRTARLGGEVKVGFQHLETCLDCEGIGAKLGPRDSTCFSCGGTGITQQTSQTPLGNYQTQHNCGVCRGTGRKLEKSCKTCKGMGSNSVVKQLKVQIPPNTEDGNKLYLRGEGNAGPFGGPPGDMYVYLKVKPAGSGR